MNAEKLKKLRKEYNVSQTDVAKFLGYKVNGKPNRSMIARWENGFAEMNPRIELLLEHYFILLQRKRITGEDKPFDDIF
jgi:transcriptional regulator with XRE-family HTH domain